MSHLPLLFQRQTGGSSSNRRAANTVSHDRLHTLEFSHDKVIRSVHTGGVACLDLDYADQRYLLAGAADASLAVYDTQQPSSAAAQQQQAEAREASDADAADGAIPGSRPALRQSQQAAAAGGNAQHTEHAALFSITKQAQQGHKYSVSAVAWYPVDSGLFVSGGFDSQVKVWDTNSQQVVCSFALASRVYAAAMSPVATSHCLVAVGSGDTQVMLCDIVSGGFTHTLSGHRAAVWAVHWSPANEWQLVTGGCDGQLRLWDIRRSGPLHIFDQHDTLQQRAQQQRQPPPQEQQQAEEAGGQRQQDEQQQASAGAALQRQGSIRSGRSKQRPLRSGSGEAGSRAGGGGGSGGGGANGSGAGGSSERMFLPERVTRYNTAHAGSITGVVPTPDGLHWVSAGTDDRVRLWDAANYRHALVNYPGTYNRATRARQLAVSDDSSVLFHPSGSVVQMFDMGSGQLVRTLGGGHFDSINCCRWNAAAEELYTGSNDCNIVVWAPAPETTTAERDGWQRDSDGDNWSD